jgi:hypothetical protein
MSIGAVSLAENKLILALAISFAVYRFQYNVAIRPEKNG